MEKLSEILKRCNLIKKYTNAQSNSRWIVTLIYSIAAAGSFLLSILNYFDGYKTMLYTTLALGTALTIACILNRKTKLYIFADILAATSVAGTFSYYALTGQNEGFAILWILVVPLVFTSVTPVISLILCLYFLLLSFLVCYSPIGAHLKNLYTKTFLERFPLLCLVCFMISAGVFIHKYILEIKLLFNAYTDELTGCYNRAFFSKIIDYIQNDNQTHKLDITVYDINQLKKVNDKKGHIEGDNLIIKISKFLTQFYKKETDIVCRVGGDEFVVLIIDGKRNIKDIAEELKISAKKEKIEIAQGFATNYDYPKKDLEGLYNIADEEMFKDKSLFYLSHKIDRRNRGLRDRRKVNKLKKGDKK